MSPTFAAVLAVPALAAPAGESQTSCAALTSLTLPHTQILESKAVSAGTFQAPDGQRYEVPAFCRAVGLATPTSDSRINFEVWLPAENWNGRYYQHGEGGGGGSINYAALADFVRNGAVAAATDDGRKIGVKNLKNADDAFKQGRDEQRNHPERVIDSAYRASEKTTTSAKGLIRAYYGKAPLYSYFAGCSGGGRAAWQAAQRYPQEWDGILVGAPANNMLGYSLATIWNSGLWLGPKARISTAKLPAIQRAALAACTPQAYVLNGIATDPRFCAVDPDALACKGPETDECLTSPQVEMLRRIYAGPRHARTGEPLYPGFPPTAETGWAGLLTAGNGKGLLGDMPWSLYSANVFVQSTFDDPHGEARIRAFDFDRDIAFAENKAISSQSLKSVLNANNPDLSPLHRRGTKVLMYFGWADAALTPLEGIVYYEHVAKTMGGLEKTRSFFRLFMSPGMAHCGGGPGANAFGQSFASTALRNDASHSLTRAMEAWVETGHDPERVIAAKYVDDDPKKGVAFTRPLCAYPQIAIYKGTGSATDAAHFKCEIGQLADETLLHSPLDQDDDAGAQCVASGTVC